MGRLPASILIVTSLGLLLAAAPAAAPAGNGGRGGRGGGGRGAGGGAARGPAALPPLGTPLDPAVQTELQAGVDQLSKAIGDLRPTLKGEPADRLADVEVLLDAVRYPMVYNEPLNINNARKSLALGMERIGQLAKGETPWTTADNVRGYYSKIDGSAQPFNLTVPVGYKPGDGKKYRLDIFLHGRGEQTMELVYESGNWRTDWKQRPMEPSADRFIVQPYGRWCNANRFAGEVDVLEAVAAIQKEYSIDANRIVMTGFSMGGASAWQLATHYSDMWAATSAGAGFTEAHDFLHLREDPVDYQKTLWHMYDSKDYAMNLANVPMVAYAGEIDPQKQASDVMDVAMKDEGLTMERIIGPGVGHTYEASARTKLVARLDELAAKGRDPSPKSIKFTTWTLRYNKMFWVSLDGLESQWTRARANADIAGDTITMKTENVTALHLNFEPGLAPWAAGAKPKLNIDGTELALPAVGADKSLTAPLTKVAGKWQIGAPVDAIRKSPGLQGPIDDAFLDSFMIVRPTGTPFNEAIGKWENSEADRAIKQWHSIFRGEARVKKDTDITDADIANNNLVLFGDPSSNAVYKRIADKLPIKWTAESVSAGSQKFPADAHAPVMIQLNPLNPKHYVVINSGFTFHDHSNNAMQTPKLPDWAIVNINEQGDRQQPLAVKAAGFFDEAWKLK